MKYYFLLISTLLSLFPIRNGYTQNLFINEFMASNSSTILDPDYNAYADWIEVFNAGTSAVNLKNHYITDNLNNPQKYKITTDLIVEPGGYDLIWADDMNTGNHTNFKLSASGESIGLYDPSLSLIDKITFGEQTSDVSEGRFPDGSSEWYKFYPATPGTSNEESGIFNRLADPVFSINGGFYSSSISLNLSHNISGVTIRYTTDGTIPTLESTLFATPILVDSTIAITARAFKENFVPSKPVVNTYFINFETELPVFSIVTDPGNFFSDTSGIYVSGTNGIIGNCSTVPRNWNQDWERPVNLEFFEKDKSPAFNVKAGIKINGGCSRIYPMKSLAFFFRGEYGYSTLNYRLFPDKTLLNFNNFILRSSAQDWWRTMFRDGMVQTLIEQGMKISYQDYRPSVLFLNGEYWGIHNIREKLNDHYLHYNHGADINNIDLIEISKAVYANNGDVTAYNSMINYLSTNNMSLPQNYEYIKSIVDVDQYIDYLIAEIYSANADWPGSNMKLWRERTSGGKWRWLIYDLDFTFGGNAEGQYNSNTLALATAANGPDWPNPPWSTIMLRKLLDNIEFKNEFIQRFAVHMNTTFEPEHVNRVIDSLKAVIASEVPRHKARWTQSISLGSNWDNNVNIMKNFATLRQPVVRNHFYEKFGITGSYSLVIGRNNPAWGKIYTHKVEIKKNNSTNTFFNNIPLKLEAVAMPGYRFVKWEGASNSVQPQIEIVISNNSSLTAVFEKAESAVTTPVINEINYKSSPAFDTEDWIEIFNPLENEIDLTGWKISDDNPANAYSFPLGSKIEGNGYIVVCRDTTKFKLLYPNMYNVFGNLDFGLSSDGDMVLLYDYMGNLIDSVKFQSSGNWTSIPNGNGPTLSLVNPQSDNSIAENWKTSEFYGTPGRLNDTYTKVKLEENRLPEGYLLAQNYPNPFNPITTINYSIPSNDKDKMANVKLIVFDVLGRVVAELVNESKEPGTYDVKWDATGFSSGVYFYHLSTGDFFETKKMLLIR
ncbi:MAG TPA: CotH kinase family protein [Ignavibacteriaceae bacterium]|nr:CotH kinase family protein [Ignavibacteriaceae bacterium]